MPAEGRARKRSTAGTRDRRRLEDPEPASRPAGRRARQDACEGKWATPRRGRGGVVMKLLVAVAGVTVAHGLLPATLSALPRAARVLGAVAADSALGPRGTAHARWTCYSGPDDASTPGARPSFSRGRVSVRGLAAAQVRWLGQGESSKRGYASSCSVSVHAAGDWC